MANREPFIRRFTWDAIEVLRPASGMAAALDPIMEASGGTRIAHGSGDADRETVDAHDRLPVPPEDPACTPRWIWLTKEQEEGSSYGIANGGLWPLCHITFTPPVFRPDDWATYRDVNRLYADAVLDEAGDTPTFFFIQDYHVCLLPRMPKEAEVETLVEQIDFRWSESAWQPISSSRSTTPRTTSWPCSGWHCSVSSARCTTA